MHDWKAYVRERLQLSSVNPHRQEQIIEEVAGQLDEIYSDSLRNGSSEQEALMAAASHIPDWRAFATKLDRRSSWLKVFVSQLPMNLLFASRSLAKSPRILLTAVFTITLGIGAITSIFSVLNGVILQPLPYSRPEQ